MLVQRTDNFKTTMVPRNFIRDLGAIELLALIGISILVALVTLMAISVAITDSGWNCRLFFRSMSAAFACALAASALGAAFGFIFGIPRVLQRRPSSIEKGQQFAIEDKSGSQLFFTNTSLEEISDWLTKIIVGIGLVQFTHILNYIHNASLLAASFIHEQAPALEIPLVTGASDPLKMDKSFISSFLFAVIISGLLLSCLFVYVEMRTRVTRIFLVTEKEVSGVETGGKISMPRLIEKLPEIVGSTGEKIEAGGTTHSVKLLEQSAEEKELANTSWGQLVGPAQIGNWAVAQAKDNNYQVAEDALREALKFAPGNVNLLQRLAELRLVRRNDQGFVDTINELAVRKVPMDTDLSRLFEKALLIGLYLTGRDRIEKTINISEALLDHPPVKAITYLHSACALGQKYKFLNRGYPEAHKVRERALQAVRDVTRLVPDPLAWERELMRQLYDQIRFNGDPKEDDLEIFKGDEEFEELITEGVY